MHTYGKENKVVVELQLAMDPKEVGQSDSALRVAFELQLTHDLALATGEHPSRFFLGKCSAITSGETPAVLVPVEIHEEPWKDGSTPAGSIASELKHKCADSKCSAFAGTVMRRLQRLEVRQADDFSHRSPAPAEPLSSDSMTTHPEAASLTPNDGAFRKWRANDNSAVSISSQHFYSPSDSSRRLSQDSQALSVDQVRPIRSSFVTVIDRFMAIATFPSNCMPRFLVVPHSFHYGCAFAGSSDAATASTPKWHFHRGVAREG